MAKKPNEEPSIYDRSEELVARLESAVASGHTQLTGAIKYVIELRDLSRDFTDGDIGAGLGFNAIDVLLDAIEAVPVASAAPVASTEFEGRARLLAADVIAIGFDDDGNFDGHDVIECQVNARRLLTGVDEGPYTGREDERRKLEERSRGISKDML